MTSNAQTKSDSLLPELKPALNRSRTDSITLREVVIQATRADAKSPVPHTNIDAKRIESVYHAQDVPYLLSNVPSLVETSDAGAGTGYTGLRIRGSDPTRVNVTINGVPLNDAESQGMYWVDLPDLASSAAEIQVQRGVGLSTNGAGAFGATVNVDLSRVESEPFVALSNAFGSFNTRRHSAYLGTGLIGNKVAFSGRVSHIQSDGFVDRAAAKLNSVHLTGAYLDDRQSLQGHFLSGGEVTYQAWYGLPASYRDDKRLRTYNAAGTERPGEPYPDEVDDYTQQHFLLHYKRQLTPGLYLQLNGHYTRGFGFYEQYKAGQKPEDYGRPVWAESDSSDAATDLVRRRRLDNHFYGLTYALRWSPAAPGAPRFTLGGALSRYKGKHFGELIWAERAVSLPKDYRYYDNDADKRDVNAYFKTEADISSRVTAFADLQLRGVGYNFQGYDNGLNKVDQRADLLFFNPKAGLNYNFRRNWTAYLFLGVGNREPNRDDYTQSTPNSRPKPERLYDVETGLKTGGENWKTSVNFFWMQYRNQLVLDGRLNDVGAYIRANVPDSYRAGLEWEASGAIGQNLLWSGNAAFSRNKVREFREFRDNWDSGIQAEIVYRNTDLAFSPNLTARAEAGWVLLPGREKHNAILSVSGKYVGKQYLDNTSNAATALSAFFFSDARLNYDLKNAIGRQLSVIVSINNLFNAQYESNGWVYRFVSAGYDPRPDDAYARAEGNNVYHLAGLFPQAGRHWMATLRVKF